MSGRPRRAAAAARKPLVKIKKVDVDREKMKLDYYKALRRKAGGGGASSSSENEVSDDSDIEIIEPAKEVSKKKPDRQKRKCSEPISSRPKRTRRTAAASPSPSPSSSRPSSPTGSVENAPIKVSILSEDQDSKLSTDLEQITDEAKLSEKEPVEKADEEEASQSDSRPEPDLKEVKPPVENGIVQQDGEKKEASGSEISENVENSAEVPQKTKVDDLVLELDPNADASLSSPDKPKPDQVPKAKEDGDFDVTIVEVKKPEPVRVMKKPEALAKGLKCFVALVPLKNKYTDKPVELTEEEEVLEDIMSQLKPGFSNVISIGGSEALIMPDGESFVLPPNYKQLMAERQKRVCKWMTESNWTPNSVPCPYGRKLPIGEIKKWGPTLRKTRLVLNRVDVKAEQAKVKRQAQYQRRRAAEMEQNLLLQQQALQQQRGAGTPIFRDGKIVGFAMSASATASIPSNMLMPNNVNVPSMMNQPKITNIVKVEANSPPADIDGFPEFEDMSVLEPEIILTIGDGEVVLPQTQVSPKPAKAVKGTIVKVGNQLLNLVPVGNPRGRPPKAPVVHVSPTPRAAASSPSKSGLTVTKLMPHQIPGGRLPLPPSLMFNNIQGPNRQRQPTIRTTLPTASTASVVPEQACPLCRKYFPAVMMEMHLKFAHANDNNGIRGIVDGPAIGEADVRIVNPSTFKANKKPLPDLISLPENNGESINMLNEAENLSDPDPVEDPLADPLAI